jgi:hypothetical protein
VSIAIILIGGPADGTLLAIPDDRPPPLYLIPITSSITELSLYGPDEPFPLRAAEYQLLLEHGRPAFDGEGHYRYQYRGTPSPPHPGQTRPTPTVDELAEMFRDPLRSAYPDSRAHLLACRTRFSLRRDARLNPEERTAANRPALEHALSALDERRRLA